MNTRRIGSLGAVIVLAAFGAFVAHGSAARAAQRRPLGVGNELLSPGVHVLDLVSREHGNGPKHLPRIAITLPSGWYNYDGWGVNDGGTLIVSFWDVAMVYPTGCRWRSKPMIDPGQSVDGLARALATRPLRHASEPKSVALAGFRGKYLQWSVPKKIDFAGCGQGYFESWTARGWASDRYQQGPGQVDRLWILDVKGQRLVIDAAFMPWATQRQRTELNRIVHSIRFAPSSAREPASATAGPGASDVTVSDINDRGQIVGDLTPKRDSTHGLVTRGFVWSKGSLRLFGRGWSDAEAEEINGRGQILGTTENNGAYGTVLWENARTKNIPLDVNGLGPQRALNDRGQVIGSRGIGRGSLPALWMNGTVWPLPFTGDWPAALNDRGQVTGEMQNGDVAVWRNGKLSEFGPGTPTAINDRGEILGSRNGDVVVWRNGTATDLGDGYPVAINGHGQVVGWRELGSRTDHAFLWQDGTTTDLGTLGGGTLSYPTAISDRGQVVGYGFDRSGVQHGFVWQNGTMIRLPAPKGYAGFPTRAVAINDHNQIVGDDLLESQSVRGRGKFAVRWTVKGDRVTTVQIAGRRRASR